MSIPNAAGELSHTPARARWWQRALLLDHSAGIDSHNAKAIYYDYAVGLIPITIIGNYLPVFAVRLGASDLLVGALTSGPYLVAFFVSLWAARLASDRHRLMRNLLIAVFCQRLFFMVLALIPSVFSRFQSEVLVIANLIGGIPATVINVLYLTLFAYAVRPEHRTHVMSIRFSIGNLTSMLALLIAGFWLERALFPFNYQVVFFASFLISLVSLWYLSRIRFLPTDAPPNIQPSLSWRSRWTQLREHRPFIKYTIYAMVMTLTVTMLTPLYPILLVNRLGVSDGWISILLTIYTATSVVIALRMDALFRRWGTRQTLVLSGIGLGMYCVLLVIAPSALYLIPVHIFAGIVVIGFSVTLTNGFLDACPEENRADFTALYMMLTSVTVFIGPLLGSAFSTAFGVIAAIVIVGVLRACSGLLFLGLK